MLRTVLMVKPSQHEKLNKLAKESNVSIAEIGRRAIDSYTPAANDDNEIEDLAMFVIKSSDETLKDIKKTCNETKKILRELKKGK